MLFRFKLKSDCVDKYFEVIDKTSFEGMTQRYIAKTGDYNYCFVGIWVPSILTLSIAIRQRRRDDKNLGNG